MANDTCHMTKKRLIDANALLATLERYVNPMPGERGHGFLSGLASVMDEIEAAPTVDAVEVVHGRWIDVNCREYLGSYCSHCQKWCDYKYKYCPNCGAKMDGDGNV